jgi:hypothetical protein
MTVNIGTRGWIVSPFCPQMVSFCVGYHAVRHRAHMSAASGSGGVWLAGVLHAAFLIEQFETVDVAAPICVYIGRIRSTESRPGSEASDFRTVRDAVTIGVGLCWVRVVSRDPEPLVLPLDRLIGSARPIRLASRRCSPTAVAFAAEVLRLGGCYTIAKEVMG